MAGLNQIWYVSWGFGRYMWVLRGQATNMKKRQKEKVMMQKQMSWWRQFIRNPTTKWRHMVVIFQFCMYVCMYVCMYACMYACYSMYVCMYVCMHACMHACTHVHTYVCMYVSHFQLGFLRLIDNGRMSRHRRIKKQHRYERLAAASQLSLW